MLNEEDTEKREAAEFEEQRKKEPDKLQIRVSAHDNNARVMKDCIREARDAAEFLKSGENDVEEWQIAGINAMFDQCNEERIIPYDLPTAIKGLLCMHILCKPEAVAEKMRKGAAVTSPKGKEHRAWENESISVCIMRTGRP